MELQKVFVWGAVVVFTSIALAAVASSLLFGTDVSLATQVRLAEQILIVEPESDVEAPAGTDYLVKVKEVLRGNVRAGSIIRVIQSGDERQHPTFVAHKPYVFLLKRDPQGPAWLHVDDIFLPVDANAVRYMVNGKVKDELALKDFQTLIGKNPPKVVAAPRKGWPGRWMLTISENGVDYAMAVLEVSQTGEEYTATLISGTPMLQTSSVSSFTISKEGLVDLKFEQSGPAFQFTGRQGDGLVRGEFLAGEFSVSPAWLEPTDLKSLKGLEQPQPSEGAAEYVKAIEAHTPAVYQKFIADHPDSPTLIQVYAFFIASTVAKNPAPAEIKVLADKYVKAAASWGSRLEMLAHLKLGGIYARSKLSDLAIPELELVEKSDTLPKLKKDARLERARFLLLSAGREAEGVALATEILKKQKFLHELTYLLARQADKDGRIDDAIALYGDIVAIPQFEQTVVQNVMSLAGAVAPSQYPRATLTHLWEKKHGTKDGLEDYLNQAYEQALRPDMKPIPPRKPGEGNRVALVELFTGATCPPCVAADVAATGLSRVYSMSDVIVLRCHENIPGPDPLANEDTEMRLKIYKESKTPSAFVNGSRIDVGGFMDQAPQSLSNLLAEIEPVLKEKTALKIDLSAKLNKESIRIRASASGEKELGPEVRLRLILAEEKVYYRAANGIRVHEMVVRQLPGGPDGTIPQGGQVQNEVDIDPVQIRAAVLESLSHLEKEHGFKFDAKPLALKSLVIIGLLQNAATNEVLQAASLKLPSLDPVKAAAKAVEKPELVPATLAN